MARSDSPRVPWAHPDWEAQAEAWIGTELERLGFEGVGKIERHQQRPWSIVLRVPLPGGDLYFKASAPSLGHEPAITETLARRLPELLPEVLASDIERGWLLMADGGTRLREVLQTDHDPGHWERVLALCAESQIAIAGHLGELLALGLPERRTAHLPELFRQLLEDETVLRTDTPDGLSPDELARVRAHAPELADLCERLAGEGLPESVHHGDLHDGNVFVRQGRYRILDWGDASASHPFFSLRTVFVSVEHTLQIPEDDVRILRLRDAYLEPWEPFGSAADLRAAFELALRLSPVCSALIWQAGMSQLDEREREAYRHAVPNLLGEFLERMN